MKKISRFITYIIKVFLFTYIQIIGSFQKSSTILMISIFDNIRINDITNRLIISVCHILWRLLAYWLSNWLTILSLIISSLVSNTIVFSSTFLVVIICFSINHYICRNTYYLHHIFYTSPSLSRIYLPADLYCVINKWNHW